MQLDRNRLDAIRNKLMWMSKHAPSSFANPDVKDTLFLLEIVDEVYPPPVQEVEEEEEEEDDQVDE